jgi:hypothetical protein
VQVSRLLHFAVLPAKGADADAMLRAVSALVISGKWAGDARDSAGMSALHAVAVQPRLLAHPAKNVALRLVELLLQTGADVNGKVRPLCSVCALQSSALLRSRPANDSQLYAAVLYCYASRCTITYLVQILGADTAAAPRATHALDGA